jgi:hypothetical protein
MSPPEFALRTIVYFGTLNKEQDQRDLDGRSGGKLAQLAIERPPGIHGKKDLQRDYNSHKQGEGLYRGGFS